MRCFSPKAGAHPLPGSRPFTIIGLGLMLSLPVYAAKPHVHGIAHLQIAVDQDRIDLIFSSPAVNLLGFEYLPRTASQKNSLKEAVAFLQSRPLISSDSGSCQLGEASVSSQLIGRDGSGKHNKHEDQHEENNAGTDKHHGHAHDEHADEEVSHTDFRVSQQLSCIGDWKNQLTTGLLERFEGIENLQVQWVSRTNQGSVELAPGNAQIDLQ